MTVQAAAVAGLPICHLAWGQAAAPEPGPTSRWPRGCRTLSSCSRQCRVAEKVDRGHTMSRSASLPELQHGAAPWRQATAAATTLHLIQQEQVDDCQHIAPKKVTLFLIFRRRLFVGRRRASPPVGGWSVQRRLWELPRLHPRSCRTVRLEADSGGLAWSSGSKRWLRENIRRGAVERCASSHPQQEQSLNNSAMRIPPAVVARQPIVHGTRLFINTGLG